MKVVKTRAEDGRVAVRNVRRHARQELEQLEKDGELSRDDLDRIEKDLERLAKVTLKLGSEPHNADLRCQAGQIMLHNGQETEGLRWLASALQEDPGHAATHEIGRQVIL